MRDPGQEDPKDRGALWATVHGITESDMTEHTHRIAHAPKTCSFCSQISRGVIQTENIG